MDKINEILKRIDEKIVRTSKKIDYLNIPCSFDIETTSMKLSKHLEKRAFMYEWSFCIWGYVFIGRTWDEFKELYNSIVNYFDLGLDKRLIVYVHNLSYEFQFIRHRFEWERIFALDKRKPVQCVTVEGVEFRCSYLLSGYSLEKLAEQLSKFKVKKLKGELDYNVIRNSLTPLTKNELQYCINDVLIVVAYIQELIEREGDITKIPLTKTGFVRKYCRDMCMYEGSHRHNTKKYNDYRKIMKALTMDSNIYILLQEAFGGGFTHGNPYNVGRTIKNVDSFDFCSAYPAVMISEEFPMSKAIRYVPKNVDDFNHYITHYCCLFRIEVTNIKSVYGFDHYISSSHCRDLKNAVESNGRIVSADHLCMTVTEQDYHIIKATYEWDNLDVKDFHYFIKGHLPKNFILAILKLYNDKTILKDVEGKEVEYLVSKENLNSCYGMCVTDPCRDEILYNQEWSSESPNVEECLKTYNKSIKRFLYYPWGIWVTAYNRMNLWSGILEFGDDYLYSDTDSLKVLNMSKHLDYIERYNNYVKNKIYKCFDFYGIDHSLAEPKTVEGKTKYLGAWEHDKHYERFKYLGAKRYMTDSDGKISITVSGVNKKIAVPYLVKTYGNNVFRHFDNKLYIPAEYTGKLTHTYLDVEYKGMVTDLYGNTAEYHEYSATHLEGADYSLSMSAKFIDFLAGIREHQK